MTSAAVEAVMHALVDAVESGAPAPEVVDAARALATAQLVEALESRAAIEQAKGVLMGARRCGADEAFQILRDLSQSTNTKLADVAQAVIAATASSAAADAAAAIIGARRRHGALASAPAGAL